MDALQRATRARAIALKIDEYLDAVRDIERRIQKAEEQSQRSCRSSAQPGGMPASFEEHVKLMFDLQVLAYQTDLTRVITFMMGREVSCADLSADRRARRAPPALASRERPREDRDDGQDQRVSHHAVRAVL